MTIRYASHAPGIAATSEIRHRPVLVTSNLSAVFAKCFPSHVQDDGGGHEVHDVHRTAVAAKWPFQRHVDDGGQGDQAGGSHCPENHVLRHGTLLSVVD